MIDNQDVDFTEQPGWLLHDEGFAGDAHYLRGTKDREREATASWTFEGVEPGVYELFATWPAGVSRMTVRYTVSAGQQTKGNVQIDQSRQTADLLARGTLWASLGQFVVEGGSLRIVLSNVGSKDNVMADAMALLPRGCAPGVILDDADPSFISEMKTKTIGKSFRGEAHRFPAKSIDPETPPAMWKIDQLPAGRYRVMATWRGYHEHCRQAVYRVTADDREVLMTGDVDQSEPPQGPRFEGVLWQEIGVVRHAGGPATIAVTASPDAQGRVVADGIWLRPAEQ
jgi:hypothetical protein